MPLCTLALVGAAGCGGHRQGETAFALRATNRSLGTAIFYVHCASARVAVNERRPPWPQARACAALETHPNALLHPRPFVCKGGPNSWWDITISGRFQGKPVKVKTSTCWTNQMKLIDFLGISFTQLRTQAAPATTLEIAVSAPAGTPHWLIERAHSMARSLDDPHPGKLIIRLGRVDVIEMWGNFVCDKACTYPSGAKPPRGDHASATIDPSDRGVISFALN